MELVKTLNWNDIKKAKTELEFGNKKVFPDFNIYEADTPYEVTQLRSGQCLINYEGEYLVGYFTKTIEEDLNSGEIFTSIQFLDPNSDLTYSIFENINTSDEHCNKPDMMWALLK